MLRTKRFYFALALVTSVAVGCGGGSNTDNTGGKTTSGGQGGDTSSSGVGGAGGSGGDTTGGGGAPVCPPEDAKTLAATELIFGEGNSGEWKAVGFNLDNLESTANSKDLCKPSAGASTSTPYPDGDMGIDNSFGKTLLPVILSLYPTWVTDINSSIQKGFFTAMLKMECLPATGDSDQFTTKLFAGTPLGAAPKFDGTDMWPVAPELLKDATDPNSSTIAFPYCSLKGNVFEAVKIDTFVLTVPLKTMTETASIKLTLHSAKMQMKLADDHKSATGGMIGGVLNTEEFVAEVKKVGALLDLCGTAVMDNIVNQVRQASDIMTDGTQDVNSTCDGITMGMGFEMKEVQLGEVGPPATVGDACP